MVCIWLWLTDIAMERSTISKFGKPSISIRAIIFHGYVTNNQRIFQWRTWHVCSKTSGCFWVFPSIFRDKPPEKYRGCPVLSCVLSLGTHGCWWWCWLDLVNTGWPKGWDWLPTCDIKLNKLNVYMANSRNQPATTFPDWQMIWWAYHER